MGRPKKIKVEPVVNEDEAEIRALPVSQAEIYEAAAELEAMQEWRRDRESMIED